MINSLQMPKSFYKELEINFSCVQRRQDINNGLKLQEDRFGLDIQKKLLKVGGRFSTGVHY